MKKEVLLELNVECAHCKKRFNFADYLTEDDYGRHIAYLVLEKCNGNLILCESCLADSKKIIEQGTYRWAVSGGEKIRIADLELLSKSGAKRVFKFLSVDDGKITFKSK